MTQFIFNSSTGSDTAASGAGPGNGVVSGSTLTGTGASFSGSVVTLDGSPDLSAFDAATWGLYLNTSTGRKFFALSSADNSAKTVTTTDAPAGTSTGLTWAIGGKRATFDNADSRLLFNSAKSNWRVITETNQNLTTSGISTTSSAGFSIEGDSLSTHRVISQSANATCFSSGAFNATYRNLKFQNTNGTKTSALAWSGSGSTGLRAYNCIFGDATNTLGTNVSLPSGQGHFYDCYFAGNASGSHINTSGAGTVLFIVACYFRSCAGSSVNYGSTSILIVCNSVFDSPTSTSIATSGGTLIIVGNTFNGSGNHHFSIGANVPISALFLGNTFTNSGGYQISALSGSDLITSIYSDSNNYWTNTSGDVSNWPLGENARSVDPAFANAAAQNYAIGTALKALGFPEGAGRTIGANQSSTDSFVDIGAAQREEPAGGGGGPLIGGRLVR